jgi:hypothetical protein
MLVLALTGALAAPMPAAAQWRLGLQGGATLGTLGGGIADGSEPVLGGRFAAILAHDLGPDWRLGLDAALVHEGAGSLGAASVDYRLVMLAGTATIGRRLPVLDRAWSLAPYGGVAVGWLGSCGVRLPGQFAYGPCTDVEPGGEPGRVEVAVPIGIELRHRYPGGSEWAVDLRHARALSALLGEGDGAARTRLWQASFGFSVPLGTEGESAAVPGDPATDTVPFCCLEEHFGALATEVGLLQIVPWYFNRYFKDDSTAVLSLDSWRRNVEQGFEWDVDGFDTNMFLHPIHGNAYFNAARTNGYGFWESAVVPWAGSFLWEFFGEKNRPSINDWVSTSASGVVIGEALFRTSRVILDNRATGVGRGLREFAGFLVNPLGGINRLMRGEMSRVGPNPDGRLPAAFGLASKAGLRVVGEGRVRPPLPRAGALPFFELAVQYGDPHGPLRQPFDDFLMTIQINGREKTALGRLQVEGSLYRKAIGRGARPRHYFTLALHYDYINNETYEVGGQSVSLGINSEFPLSGDWTLHTRVQALGTFMGGVDSEYAGDATRDYDLGSGAGFRLFATLHRGREPLLEAWYIGAWVHSLSGASGDHLIQFANLTARYPFLGPLGLGAEFIYAARQSYYRNFDDLHRQSPQLRLFASWTP